MSKKQPTQAAIQSLDRPPPRTVLAAKRVELVLVKYTDERGDEHTQLAVLGENNANLLNSKELGFGKVATPQGVASDWLVNGVKQKLSEG